MKQNLLFLILSILKIRRSFLYKYDVEEKKNLELGVLNKRALNIHVLLISRKSVRLSFTYDTWQ